MDRPDGAPTPAERRRRLRRGGMEGDGRGERRGHHHTAQGLHRAGLGAVRLRPPSLCPSRPFPGSAMLHPLVLGAVAVLILNDHLLKARWPSWWTGKLSDVAGLAM